MKKYISIKYYPEKNNYSYIKNVLFNNKNRANDFLMELKLNKIKEVA